MGIDVATEQQQIISTLLKLDVPDVSVWAYGSRINGSARSSSDLDMVVFTKPEQWLSVSNLREAFGDSDLPFRVDLFIWAEVPEQFHAKIKANYVVLQGK